MLCYAPDQKPVVKALQANSWDNDDIMTYLSYLNKKKTLIKTGRKHGTYSRDSDRSKVYTAEFKYERTYGTGKQFKDIKEAQKYCDRVLSSATWKKMSNTTHIALSTMHGNRTAGRAWKNNIDLNVKGGLNQYVLLHEMEKKLKLSISKNVLNPDAWMKMKLRMEKAREKRVDNAA